MVNNSIEVRATSPGIVLEIPVAAGAVVQADDDLLILECMKMELPVPAPTGGTVRRIEVQVGDRVDVDDLLLTLDGRIKIGVVRKYPLTNGLAVAGTSVSYTESSARNRYV